LGLQDVPIIALTANAISGMREIFLGNGFNDYISKPIDINSLDEMMARWVPVEKQIKIDREIRRETFNGETGILIPGVDTKKGINMTGGTEAGYRKVLAQFYKDALERLPVFAEAPVETAHGTFAAQAHAIKSAAGTIGAAEVSAEAAVLEAAGKAGDLKSIGETLSGFREHLAELVEGIGKALEDQRSEKDGESNAAGGTESAAADLLPLLRAALEAKNMKETDRLLAELENVALDTETRERIEALSDKILMGEYEEAVDAINSISMVEENTI
jgi:HPt (histidine-containing phosphotransfer) domain-containing protein